MIKKTDKPAEPKPSMTEQVKGAAAQPTESWNSAWSIRRRLLEARKQLRGTRLWEQFETERSFEAFSIHKMASGIEEIMLANGVLSSFQVTKWSKSGNVTVVEGVAQFMSVDDGEVFEVATFGEGVDDSDKGAGKALSYARKNGFIQALNLAVGTDNEKTDDRAKHAPAGPTMSGTPQQAGQAKTAEAYIQPMPDRMQGGANGHASTPSAQKMYTLQQRGVKARAVLGSGVLSNCWAIIQNSGTVADLDDFVAANEAMLTEFSADDPATGGALHKIVQTRRGDLAAKGLM